jgi:hypothetical protein
MYAAWLVKWRTVIQIGEQLHSETHMKTLVVRTKNCACIHAVVLGSELDVEEALVQQQMTEQFRARLPTSALTLRDCLVHAPVPAPALADYSYALRTIFPIIATTRNLIPLPMRIKLGDRSQVPVLTPQPQLQTKRLNLENHDSAMAAPRQPNFEVRKALSRLPRTCPIPSTTTSPT